MTTTFMNNIWGCRRRRRGYTTWWNQNLKLIIFHTPLGSVTSVVISGLCSHTVSLSRFATFYFIPFKFTHAICHPWCLRTNSKPAQSIYSGVRVSLCILRPLPFLCLPLSELTNQFQRFCFAWDPDGCERIFISHHSQSCKLMKSLFKLVKVKQETLLNGITKIASYCCCLVAQLCPTLCHPMDCRLLCP